MQDEPVWVTGLGVLSPVGNDYASVAENLLAGKSGIGPVRGIDVSNHPCKIAGQIGTISGPAVLDPVIFDAHLPLEQCVLRTTADALVDAGLWESRHSRRMGVVLGIGVEWMQKWNADANRGGNLVERWAPDDQSLRQTLREILGIQGPVLVVAAACASGNYAFHQALQWMRRGIVDCCLAGGCDMGVTNLSLAGFGNLRALTRRNDEPTRALRPFDRDRDGMVLGEGGALFLLERQEAAQKRGREPYVELAGCGLTSDAFHLVTPNPDPEHGVRAVQRALADARISPDDVEYVNAHATATPTGDVCEARLLQRVFGDRMNRVPVSSTKSMTGHLLGAAAAVEAVAAVVAIREGVIPPTINLDNPDPECPLLHVANQPREHRVRVAVSNSFGFGGNNSALVLRAA